MDPFIGQIMQVGFRYAPVNWLNCNGAVLQIGQNQALYALLGTTFGGGGVTDFALPDARGRTMIGAGSGPGLTPRQAGAKGGAEQTSLNQSQLPSHTHNALFQQTGTATFQGWNTAIAGLNYTNESATPENGSYLGALSDPDTNPTIYVPAANATMSGAQQVRLAGVGGTVSGLSGAVSIGNTGQNAPVALMPPFLAVTTIIASIGIWPDKPD